MGLETAGGGEHPEVSCPSCCPRGTVGRGLEEVRGQAGGTQDRAGQACSIQEALGPHPSHCPFAPLSLYLVKWDENCCLAEHCGRDTDIHLPLNESSTVCLGKKPQCWANSSLLLQDLGGGSDSLLCSGRRQGGGGGYSLHSSLVGTLRELCQLSRLWASGQMTSPL